MKHFNTLIKGAAVLFSMALIHHEAQAQLGLTTGGTTYTVDFDGTVTGVSNGIWAGTGFQPMPTAGRLDSDAWQINGWSNGPLAFGGTRITAGTDYTRGVSAGGTGTGGMFAFNGGAITGRALGFQPTAADWTPGDITMRIQNNTGAAITEFDIAYNVYWNNDQARSNSFNFSWSSDNVTYTNVGALDVTSPTTADVFGFTLNARSTTISGLSIANGAYFYIRWSGDDISGAGAGRDEFALDDIQVTGYNYTMVRFSGSSTNVNETGVSTNLTLTITNPDPSNATTVDVVLTSGSAARINGYSTQSKVFPAGSAANETVTITITDNGTCDLDEVLIFELQSIAGGNNAMLGTPSQYTVTIDDDETGPVSWQQDFDAGVNDNWTINLGAANVSSANPIGDNPPSERVLTSPNSWQVINQTSTLELATVDVSGWVSTVLQLRLSSVSTGGNGADPADSVAIYLDIDGGGFPINPDISISGNNNARWSYSTGTGLAIGTAGVPDDYQPVGGGLRTTDGYSTVEITIPDGAVSVALRVIAKNNLASEIWNVDNVRLTGWLCQPVYYSRANGDETTASWHTTRTGPATAVTFDKNATMVVQLGHTITTTGAAFDVRSLNVETGGTLNMGGSTTLGVFGPSFDIDGTFSGSDDDFEFQGTTLQTISGNAGTILVDDLTLDGAGGILVSVNILQIRGTLQLTSGNFNANGKEVQLISDIAGTARLGPVGPTASYSSLLRLQRYIPAGVTDWRLLCSPLLGKTIADWQDDFITSGFPNSTFPSFPFNSILSYDETNPGSNSSDGLTGATNNTNPLTVGTGKAAWSGDALGGTAAFTIDVRGVPNIALTPFTIPMSYTNASTVAVDGLNLVGNPLPSPIDFGAMTLDTDVDSMYYIYDPGSGTNAAWDEVNQVGTGGANGNIQSSQGFWLHCTGPNNLVTVSEGAKVLEPILGGIFSEVQDDRPMVRMKLTTAMNSFDNEALVHFISGSPSLGQYDIHKFDFSHPEAPSICSVADGARLSINAMGVLSGAVDIPVQVDVQVTGEYTITFSDVEALLSHTCLSFEDLVAGIVTPVNEGSTYTFAIDTADAADPARFVLHMGIPINVTHADATCGGLADGSATALGSGMGPWDYTWMDAFGNVIAQENGLPGPSVLDDLAAGTYSVSVDGNSGCDAITSSFTIAQPAPLDLQANATPTSCPAMANGNIDITVMGGTGPYTFDWSDGSVDEDLVNADAGSYDVIVTDAHGCAVSLSGQLIGEGVGPSALFVPSTATANTGEEVEFFNLSPYGLDYEWSFGDGATSTDAEPLHAFDLAGTYPVTLTVTDEGCQSTYSLDITVLGATGLVNVDPGTTLVAWSDANGFVVEWYELDGPEVKAEVMDVSGRVVAGARAFAGVGRMNIPAQDVENGTYVVRIIQGTLQKSFKLPLVR